MKPPSWFLKAFLIFAIGASVGFLINQAFKKSPATPTISKDTNQVIGTKSESYSSSPNFVEGQTARVIRIIDGDTVQIEGGQKIRYIGIDTPEIVDPRSAVQCYAYEASLKNRELVEGKSVILDKDISETDKYGRLLRYVFVDNLFINDYLVREGYAYASSYPPDVKYQNQLQKAEQEARDNNRGLWSQCGQNDQIKPGLPSITVPESGCQIKGNISSSGEKIYHLPSQRYYDKTVIDETKGERWFCSEEDAISAGWRKSKI